MPISGTSLLYGSVGMEECDSRFCSEGFPRWRQHHLLAAFASLE
jgi:hypothetical protein